MKRRKESFSFHMSGVEHLGWTGLTAGLERPEVVSVITEQLRTPRTQRAALRFPQPLCTHEKIKISGGIQF